MIDQYTITIACTFVAISTGIIATWALVNPYGMRIRARVHELAERDKSVGDESVSSSNSFGFTRLAELLMHVVPYGRRNQALIQQRLSSAGVYELSAVSIYFAAKLMLMTLPPTIAIAAAWCGWLRME